MLGKEPRSDRGGILLEQRHRSLARYSAGRLDEAHHPIGINLRLNHGGLEAGIVCVTSQRFGGQ